MAESQREFDIVVYGATGFVGKLTAEYLSRAAGPVRIALAGRSPERLAAVRQSLGESAHGWPILTADASSPETLEAMAARTRVVLTTVGPYAKYGLPLVAACAAAGTDYADLTGEPHFIRESIDLCHKEAADTGARIVHSCGFDSIPSDLTVFACYRRAEQDKAGQLLDTNMVVRSVAGGVSGGTVGSGIEMMRAASKNAEVRRLLNDPYSLSTDRAAEPEFGAQPDAAMRRGEQIAPELAGTWTAGFFMAGSNTRIVRRSNALQDWSYGRRFRYAESMSVGSSMVAPLTAAAISGAQSAMLSLGTRYFRFLPTAVVDRIAPKPGTGPSQQTRENGHYKVETYTTTTHGARYRTTMAQQGDPGYQATAVLLGESGLALALDRDTISDLRGVLTPAAAMGDALIDRLPAVGVTLEVDRLD